MAEGSAESADRDQQSGIGVPGGRCDLCRTDVLDARPFAIHGREFIPAMCEDCFRALKRAGRLDLLRDKEVFEY